MQTFAKLPQRSPNNPANTYAAGDVAKGSSSRNTCLPSYCH